MKQMYRIICAVLCVVLCLGLIAGCSSSQKTTSSAASSTVASSGSAAASGSTAASSSAAASTSASSSASTGDVTLTVWFSDVREGEKTLPEAQWTINVYARKFEQENPGVKIKIVYQADQAVAQNKLKAAVAANTAPDIVNTYSGYLVTYYKDIFTDITQYVPQDDLDNLNGWEGVREDMKADGAIYGYPEAGNELGIFMYNKELVAKAGVDLEGDGAPKNAQEFKAALQKIKDSGTTPIIGGDQGVNSLWMFPTGAWWTQMSGTDRVVSDSTAETKFADDQGFIDTLNFTASLYADGLVNKDYANLSDPLQQFYNKKGAMYPTGNWDVASGIETMGDNLGVYCVPSYDGKVDDTLIGGIGQSWSVLKTCQHPDIAVKFLSFLSQKDYVIAQTKLSGKVPQRKDITAEEVGWAGNEVYEKIMNCCKDVVIWNDNVLQTDVQSEYYKRTGMVVIGQTTAEDCAKQLDKVAEDAAE
jgi:raffinose/stachyose/melibiose transport system substrate-binding protein